MTWFAKLRRLSSDLLFGLVVCGPLLAGNARAEFVVEVDSNGVLEGAVVVARALSGVTAARPLPDELTMVQINRQFDPFILPVPLNVPVKFPNRDNTAHHVYSFAPAGTFELPLYKGDSPRSITFTRTGVVPLGCNIHDWMIGYIYVVDSPYYTQLEGGAARFDVLPSGPYEISIWHPAIDGDQPPSWQIEVSQSASHQSLSLDFPFVAVIQPQAPAERFDEQWDY